MDRSTRTLGIITQSRPFTARFSGKCPLLGLPIYAGQTKVRTLELVVLATGTRYTATVPLRTEELLAFTTWSSDGPDGVSFATRYTRGGDAEAALALLDEGHSVDIITSSTIASAGGFGYETWKRDADGKYSTPGLWGKRKSRAQLAAVLSKARAYRVAY